MKRFIIAFAILFAVTSASAGTVVISGFGGTQITLTSTANQDSAIARIVALQNANITAQNAILAKQQPPGTPLPLQTSESYVRDTLVSAIVDYIKQQREQNKIDACDAYSKLGGAAKTNIDTALGGKSPCS